MTDTFLERIGRAKADIHAKLREMGWTCEQGSNAGQAVEPAQADDSELDAAPAQDDDTEALIPVEEGEVTEE